MGMLTMLTVCWQQQGAEPESSSRLQHDGEQQLTCLFEGVRRTPKTTPYLHFSSPLGRRPYPRLVKSIQGQSSSCPANHDLSRKALVTCSLLLLVPSLLLSALQPPTHPAGVKMKSSKTQTSLALPPRHRPQAPSSLRHPVIRPAILTSADHIPMAIPLGSISHSTPFPAILLASNTMKTKQKQMSDVKLQVAPGSDLPPGILSIHRN